MKTILSRTCGVVSVVLVVSILQLTSSLHVTQTAQVASLPLTVNGTQHFQTMDGFGTSINSASWMGGALKPTLDTLANGGTTLWRVILDNADWEATNDDADPDTYNWGYYDGVYGSAKFQDLWNTIAYLNGKGFTGNNIILSFMGPGPAWMGRDTLTDTSPNRSEWAEMMASVAIYGRTVAGPTGQGVQFRQYAPSNESDNNCQANHEGICMSGAMYGDVMNRLAVKLNTAGLTDLHILGPETAVVSRGTDDYMPAMMNYPTLMAKVDHIALHDYSGNTGGADIAIKNSAYPTKNLWMSEVAHFDNAFSMVGQNAAAILMWDGFDSVYNHPQLRGKPPVPGNDNDSGPALIAYNPATQIYSPRPVYYQYEQLYKYVPAGSVRVAANQSASGVTTYAFTDPVSGRVTIVGYNASGSSVTFAGTLTNVATAVPSFEYYTTTATTNFLRGADVPVSGGVFSVVAPANGIFTLTYSGAADVSPPSAPVLAAATTATPGQVGLSWSTSTDNIGVSGYDVYRGPVSGFIPSAGNKIATVVAPTTTYTDNTAAGGHYYKVLARDGSGNTAASNEVSATVTADITPPSVPTNVAATALSANRIDVSWTASADASGVANYSVARNGTPLGTATSTSYSDTTAAPGTTYSYTVSATDNAGNVSAASAAVGATTPATSPLSAGTPVITRQASASNAITSGSFTAHAGDVVVAFFGSDGPGGVAQSFNTPTTTGLTWSLRKRANPISSGTAEIWSAVASNTVTGTLSATRTVGSYWGSVTVVVFSNADTSTAMTAAGGSGSNSAPSINLTTTRVGSQVWAAGGDWTNINPRVVGAGQSKVDEFMVTGFGDYWSQRRVDPTVTPGVTTMNDTSPSSSDLWNMVAIEISPVINDTTAPNAPTGLNAAATSFAHVHLGWNASTDNVGVVSYNVLRNGVALATVSGAITSYDDNALTPGASYTYTVTAADAASNASAPTSVVSVTLPTVSLTVPTAGASLSGAVAVSANTVAGLAGVQFRLDGANLAAEDTTAPYGVTWDTTAATNAGHSLSAVARDSWGNVMTVGPVGVTVNNVTASLAIDVNVSADPTGTASTIVSPSFSTTSTNELLVALVESSGPNSSGGQSIKTLTGGGVTWTMRQRANTSNGTAEIWTAPATVKLTNASVTATRNSSGYSGSITILSFSGANLGAIGAIAKASATTGLPTLSLTTTKAGSVVLGAGNDWDGANARTVGSGQTLVHQYLQTTTGDTYWNQKTSPTTAGGQVAILNNITPTPNTHRWNLAAIEILPLP
jgi:fibronectin type 3 domain-containing protein